ncbi:transporter substrate-binding domain-containing protein [Maridesulfovibrio ferrireducens]|uniref:transporter substrate-binding domain-containing protein n=1 Tax=Maridesulfovibrio ferrireducens TaxID=246191 RepID=UPI001A31D977|nr:transporter substrate-binding domain-containing protein [Maridesulfovibrio ferrireducens]MBI9111455.1 transporter substrate-binding domain-containing protein [Maridesulfovibrio ferrireducens]
MTLWRTINTGLAAVILIIGVSTAVWAGNVRQNLAQESTLETIQKNQTLRVGFSTFKPWAMKDKNGDFIGFEIDVAKRLAEDMGVKIRFIPTKWDGIIPALLTGKFDIIIGGMGITPKRNLKVNFSDPYEFTGMSIIASKSAASGKKSLADFNNPATNVSVRLGTTAEKAAQNFLPKATLLKFSDEAASIQELLNGRVACLIASNPLPSNLAQKYPEKLYLPLKDDFTKEPIGFAIRKSDPDFLNYLNNWIKVTNSEGWLESRFNYWFKTAQWESLVE